MNDSDQKENGKRSNAYYYESTIRAITYLPCNTTLRMIYSPRRRWKRDHNILYLRPVVRVFDFTQKNSSKNRHLWVPSRWVNFAKIGVKCDGSNAYPLDHFRVNPKTTNFMLLRQLCWRMKKLKTLFFFFHRKTKCRCCNKIPTRMIY